MPSNIATGISIEMHRTQFHVILKKNQTRYEEKKYFFIYIDLALSDYYLKVIINVYNLRYLSEKLRFYSIKKLNKTPTLSSNILD